MRIPAILLLPIFILSQAQAQYRGSLQGTVTDTTGAVVSGATVTLTDKETNRTLTAVTNEAGVYNIGSLHPSRYMLTVEKQGFKKKVLEDAGIVAEQANAINIVLDIGATTETVTVNGNQAPLLDTETATISGTITSQEVESMPAYGRDPFQLLQLAPGVFGDGAQLNSGGSNFLPGRNYANGTGGAPGATQGIFGTNNSPAISVAGSRQELTDIQIDGVGATDAAWGGTSIVTPNIDSIKEVKVITTGYDAEDGRYSAGEVKVITQNGTNQFHGAAHWRADRPSFNATPYQGLTPSVPPIRNETLLNDFGGALGGPILHNRLFGFFSYEIVHSSDSVFGSGWYETPQFRAYARPGSVAALMLGYKGVTPINPVVDESPNLPEGLRRDCASIGLVQGVNCNFIPNQGLNIGSPLTTPLGTHDPTFQSGSNPGVGNGLDAVPDIQFVSQSFNQPLLEQQFQGRVDYDLNPKNLVAVSFFYVPVSQTLANGSARIMNLYKQKSENRTATVIWDSTLSATMQNEFRANVGGWRENSLEDNPQSPWGLPNLNIGNLVDSESVGTATIGSAGQPSFGISNPDESNQWTYATKDVLTKVHGSHTLKLGGELTRILFTDAAPWEARPSYSFNNVWDLLNDAPISELAAFNPQTGVPSDFRFDTRERLFGFFVQDNYKVKPTLTLTAGLRWDYFGPISEKHGNLPVVELGQGADILTGLKIRTGGNLYNAQKGNFGPQLGFAWSPSRMANKLVVRGGFGIGYAALQEANGLDGRTNPPYTSSQLFLTGSQIVYGPQSLPKSLTSFYGYGVNPAGIIAFSPATNLPEPGQTPVNLRAFEQNWPTTRTYRYSLETEYDLGHEWVATLGYQGTASRHLTRLYNYGLFEYAQLLAAGEPLAAFNPAVETISMYDDEGFGNYNALLADLRHRFGSSFTLESQYRWARGMDTGSNNYSPAQHNGVCSCDGGSYQFTMNDEYAPSDFDVTHMFKLFGIWSPKLFSGRNPLLEKTLGGWSLSGILNFHTGFPWTVSDPNIGSNSIYQQSGSAGYGGGGVLRPGYYLGGFHPGNFRTPNPNFLANGALSLFPENNPTTGQPCYAAGPALSDIIAGTASPGPIPCTPAIGRNAFWGPGYFDIDATFGKTFGLPSTRVFGEDAKLKFTANFYNLLNNVNLTNVDGSVVDSTFGVALSGLGARTVDLQLQFNF